MKHLKYLAGYACAFIFEGYGHRASHRMARDARRLPFAHLAPAEKVHAYLILALCILGLCLLALHWLA